MSSVWNPDNVRDVAESVGIASLADNVVEELARDVDFRLAQVLEEALKFMRHGKRTTLSTQDVSNALKVLNVEPLYGYESTRPLRFGEASLGPGQPLYYVEDEEVDFEKLINAPLPKVPRERTGSPWKGDLLPKGTNANPHLAAANGLDNVNVKPLVKHVLSKESQELFAKLSGALIDETNIEWQNAALAAIRTEPGIHQLTTYLLTFIAEKVTHSVKNLFVLQQMMQATSALLDNQAIYLDPYVAYMVPPVLTCCTGKYLGPKTQVASSNASLETLNGVGTNGHGSNGPDHFKLRQLAASILSRICQKYGSSNQGLKSRIARTCLRQFMDIGKPLGTHYGALLALLIITGNEGMKMLVLPNLKMYNDDVLKGALAEEGKKKDAERVLAILVEAVKALGGTTSATMTNGVGDMEGLRERLKDKVGDVVADQIIANKLSAAAQVILETDVNI
ncbi:hypothetical protein EKO04_010762 [Ascochyta lentis]|uniref:TBP-associated factor 6 n=1 Tax=Ascochyta lentis TaxID=205686 RepID=A0A8H7IXS4_9PLEO|nr:hypothetical protein EKO04_010762 [Ascochyta lentis]